jgi:hypothetical protein
MSVIDAWRFGFGSTVVVTHPLLFGISPCDSGLTDIVTAFNNNAASAGEPAIRSAACSTPASSTLIQSSLRCWPPDTRVTHPSRCVRRVA